jgi:hypothetical protein
MPAILGYSVDFMRVIIPWYNQPDSSNISFRPDALSLSIVQLEGTGAVGEDRQRESPSRNPRSRQGAPSPWRGSFRYLTSVLSKLRREEGVPGWGCRRTDIRL